MVVLETGFLIFMWVCTKNRKVTTYKRIKTKDEGEEHKNFKWKMRRPKNQVPSATREKRAWEDRPRKIMGDGNANRT